MVSSLSSHAEPTACCAHYKAGGGKTRSLLPPGRLKERDESVSGHLAGSLGQWLSRDELHFPLPGGRWRGSDCKATPSRGKDLFDWLGPVVRVEGDRQKGRSNRYQPPELCSLSESETFFFGQELLHMRKSLWGVMQNKEGQ